MRAKKLNSNGMQLFESFLKNARDSTPNFDQLEALRNDASYVEPSSSGIEVSPQSFASKWEVAKYMCDQISDAGLVRPPDDEGLWSWLAVYFSKSLLPSRTSSSMAIRETARYVCSTRWDRYYRHRIAGPTRTLWNFRDDPEIVNFMLYGPPYTFNDTEEQMWGRHQRIQNRVIVKLANRLYFDTNTKRAKRRAQNKKNTPGSLRRLLKICEQYERTYDLYSKDLEGFYSMLPREFDDWKH
jgi:hypothetical protein